MQILSGPALSMCESPKFSRHKGKGSKNMMVTIYVGPEVEIRPHGACTMKNMQYNSYLWSNRRNFRVWKKIGVEEHDGDVRFYSGSGNTALSHMRNASGHNY